MRTDELMIQGSSKGFTRDSDSVHINNNSASTSPEALGGAASEESDTSPPSNSPRGRSPSDQMDQTNREPYPPVSSTTASGSGLPNREPYPPNRLVMFSPEEMALLAIGKGNYHGARPEFKPMTDEQGIYVPASVLRRQDMERQRARGSSPGSGRASPEEKKRRRAAGGFYGPPNITDHKPSPKAANSKKSRLLRQKTKTSEELKARLQFLRNEVEKKQVSSIQSNQQMIPAYIRQMRENAAQERRNREDYDEMSESVVTVVINMINKICAEEDLAAVRARRQRTTAQIAQAPVVSATSSRTTSQSNLVEPMMSPSTAATLPTISTAASISSLLPILPQMTSNQLNALSSIPPQRIDMSQAGPSSSIPEIIAAMNQNNQNVQLQQNIQDPHLSQMVHLFNQLNQLTSMPQSQHITQQSLMQPITTQMHEINQNLVVEEMQPIPLLHQLELMNQAPRGTLFAPLIPAMGPLAPMTTLPQFLTPAIMQLMLASLPAAVTHLTVEGHAEVALNLARNPPSSAPQVDANGVLLPVTPPGPSLVSTLANVIHNTGIRLPHDEQRNYDFGVVKAVFEKQCKMVKDVLDLHMNTVNRLQLYCAGMPMVGSPEEERKIIVTSSKIMDTALLGLMRNARDVNIFLDGVYHDVSRASNGRTNLENARNSQNDSS